MVGNINQDVGGDCLLLVSLLSLFVSDLLIIHLLKYVLVCSCLIASEWNTCLIELFLYSDRGVIQMG